MTDTKPMPSSWKREWKKENPRNLYATDWEWELDCQDAFLDANAHIFTLAPSPATDGDTRRVLPWPEAGGPNECPHGYAKGLRCPGCESASAPTDAIDAKGTGDTVIMVSRASEVSTAELTPEEVALAHTEKVIRVEPNGYGYVPREWFWELRPPKEEGEEGAGDPLGMLRVLRMVLDGTDQADDLCSIEAALEFERECCVRLVNRWQGALAAEKRAHESTCAQFTQLQDDFEEERRAHAGTKELLRIARNEPATQALTKKFEALVADRDATIADLREKLKEAEERARLADESFEVSLREIDLHRQQREVAEALQRQAVDALGAICMTLGADMNTQAPLTGVALAVVATIRATCSTLESERDNFRQLADERFAEIERAREIRDGLVVRAERAEHGLFAARERLRETIAKRDEALAKSEGLEIAARLDGYVKNDTTWFDVHSALRRVVTTELDCDASADVHAMREAFQRLRSTSSDGLRDAVVGLAESYEADQGCNTKAYHVAKAIRSLLAKHPAPSSSAEPVGLRDAISRFAKELRTHEEWSCCAAAGEHLESLLSNRPANPTAEKGEGEAAETGHTSGGDTTLQRKWLTDAGWLAACVVDTVGPLPVKAKNKALWLLENRDLLLATHPAPLAEVNGVSAAAWEFAAKQADDMAAQLQARIDELNDGWERIVCREVANAAALRVRIDKAAGILGYERRPSKLVEQAITALTSTEAGEESAEIPGVEWDMFDANVARIVDGPPGALGMRACVDGLELHTRHGKLLTREQVRQTLIPLLRRFDLTGKLTASTESAEAGKGKGSL